jgi:cellulose biosynthesis protein BcsQ
MIKIAVFNHKGGVGKTTSAFHIAWKLTQSEKNVLLVDTDSQCNLSEIVLNRWGQYRDNPQDMTGFEYYTSCNIGLNIKDSLSPAFSGAPRPLEGIDCPHAPENYHLMLLPGSFDITEYDVQLGVSFNLSETFSTLMNLPGSFNAIIEKTANKNGCDIAVIDMNPSLSAINQALLLSCDFFIIPLAPDYFSRMAIRSLQKVLVKWEKWGKNARTQLADSAYPLPIKSPKFLGAILQRYNIRHGNPTRASQTMIDQLTPELGALVRIMDNEGLIAPEFDKNNLYLGQISDFQSLSPYYHYFGIPIFMLNQDRLKEFSTKENPAPTGQVLSNYLEMINTFDRVYAEVCSKIPSEDHVEVSS